MSARIVQHEMRVAIAINIHESSDGATLREGNKMALVKSILMASKIFLFGSFILPAAHADKPHPEFPQSLSTSTAPLQTLESGCGASPDSDTSR